MSTTGRPGSGSTFRNGQVRLLSGSTAVLLSGVALAQVDQAPPATATDALQEIVVTAEKRTERLQDVPLAVSAVSGEQFANSQITASTRSL